MRLEESIEPKKRRREKPNGKGKQYIIVCNRPRLQFLVESLSPSWLRIKEMHREGRLQENYPHIMKPTPARLMTDEQLKEMTLKFDAFGEFHTDLLEHAKAAWRAVADVDPFVRLHTTSLPLPEDFLEQVEEEIKKKAEAAYAGPSGVWGRG